MKVNEHHARVYILQFIFANALQGDNVHDPESMLRLEYAFKRTAGDIGVTDLEGVLEALRLLNIAPSGVHVHTCINIYMHTYQCVRVYTYMYLYIHVYI